MAEQPIAGTELPEGSQPPIAKAAANSAAKKKLLKVRPLPSPEQIYNATPAEGINIVSLATKFRSRLDETNVELFTQIVKTISSFADRLSIKRLPTMPLPSQISGLVTEARTEPPRPKLSDIQVTSEFVGDVKISFSDYPEGIRGASKGLPPKLYRTFYETSATLSCFVSTDTHTKHRENPFLKLQDGNAFQALKEFEPIHDLTRQRIERRLDWRIKVEPSSYISAFNHIDHAIKRAKFHYKTSKRIGERVCVASISTADMVAATVHGLIKETTKVFDDKKLKSTTETTREIQIPVWVHDLARPQDSSAITSEQFEASGAEMWMSITKLRYSNLRSGFGKGHDYEWLACGSIPKKRIERVMPFDGEILHRKQGPNIVKSTKSSQPWIFDWGKQMWLLSHDQNNATSSRPEKRKLNTDILASAGSKRQELDQGQEESAFLQDNPTTTPCPQCGGTGRLVSHSTTIPPDMSGDHTHSIVSQQTK